LGFGAKPAPKPKKITCRGIINPRKISKKDNLLPQLDGKLRPISSLY
jgi:hypothetical protein